MLKKLGSPVFAGLLTTAFLASLWFLFNVASDDYSTIAELLLVAVLSVEGIVAVVELQAARDEGVQTALAQLYKDYSSAEMLLAVSSLWNFYRDNGDRFNEAYVETWKGDEKKIAGLPLSERVDATSGTLHHHRRLVKHFYDYLATLHELGVYPDSLVFTYWSAQDLDVIPKILLPLDAVVQREISLAKPHSATDRLQKLHEHSIAYRERQARSWWRRTFKPPSAATAGDDGIPF